MSEFENNEEKNKHREQVELSWVENVELEYLRTHKDNLIWGIILEMNHLEEEWLEEFLPEIELQNNQSKNNFGLNLWTTLTGSQTLSFEFVERHQDKIDWERLIKKKLSKKMLDIFLHKFSWDDICKYQKLDESFIRKYQNEVNWNEVSKYTCLTTDFVLEFKDKLDWSKISYVYKFNPEQMKQVEHMVIKNNNMLYMSVEQIKSTLPSSAIIIDDKYIVGYMDFIDGDNFIYCFNEVEHVEIPWSIDLIGKELEADSYNYMLYDSDSDIKQYGFACYNTIKEKVTHSFNCGFMFKHIIKVLIPIEFAKHKKVYGRYDGYNTKKITVVEEVFYDDK